MARFLYVVARDRLDLFDRLSAEFSRAAEVRVIVDRRVGERRRSPGAYTPERRRADRRTHRELDMELRSVGSFITRIGESVSTD